MTNYTKNPNWTGNHYGPGKWRTRGLLIAEIVSIHKEDAAHYADLYDPAGRHWSQNGTRLAMPRCHNKNSLDIIEPADDETAARHGWVPVKDPDKPDLEAAEGGMKKALQSENAALRKKVEVLEVTNAALREGAVEELTADDLFSWADGIQGALGTEHALKTTELEARLSHAIIKTFEDVRADYEAMAEDSHE